MNIIFRNFILVIILSFSAGCSLLESNTKTERADILSIKSVAVVSFTVSAVMETGSGLMNDLHALISLAGAVVSDDENKSSNQQLANGSAAGFSEAMSASGHWHVLSVKKVSTNTEIKSLTENAEKRYEKVSMDGTPAVRLRLDGKPSEYAEQAAKALGVDGVMMLAANDMSYFLDEGEHAIGTGVAKVKFNGVFKLYDKEGNSVWETEITARSDETASMVAGFVKSSEAYRLGKSLGRALAVDVLEKYKKDIGK